MSEPKQPVDFDDEGAVIKLWKATRQCVALIVVDNEELAARPVLPPQPKVRAHGVVARVVLEQAADEHQRRDGIGGPRREQLRNELPLREVDPVKGNARLHRQLRRHFEPAAAEADGRPVSAEEAPMLDQQRTRERALWPE